MLLKSEILDAQSKCKSAAECARYLKVSYPTYKKWAKFHDVFENLINQAGKGIAKNTQRNYIEPYTKGEKDHQNPKKYLKQLVKYGYKLHQCELCGYDEERIDGKKPLVINFIDGNKYNSHLDNIQIVCYNCLYTKIGTEIIGIKTRRYWTTDYVYKARDMSSSKYDDFEYNDFDLEEAENRMDIQEGEQDVDELFKELNQ